MESRFHIVISGVLALMFVVFATLQYNDPDPLIWISIYGMIAVLMITNIWRRIPVMISIATMVAALAGCYFLWPQEYQGLSGKMDSRPNVELARESLGLLISAVACLYLWLRGWMRMPKRPWERG